MTDSLALLPPAMVAIGLATLVVGDDQIYESQLRSRADSPAHRAAFGLPLLSLVIIADVMKPPRLVLPADTPTGEACRLLESAGSVAHPWSATSTSSSACSNQTHHVTTRRSRRGPSPTSPIPPSHPPRPGHRPRCHPFAATTVATAPWPRGSLALSIDRHSQLIAPRPDTALETGDVIVAVVPASAEAELRGRLDGGGTP